MSERFFLLLLFLGGTVYVYFGVKIEVPIAYDVLGPRTFPVLLGGCLLVLCLLSLYFHAMSTLQINGRVAGHALAVLFYLLSFQLLGFMLATTISTYAIARFIGCSWMQGLLTGLVMAIFFYGVFHFLLGVPLPLGSIFRLAG